MQFVMMVSPHKKLRNTVKLDIKRQADLQLNHSIETEAAAADNDH